MEQINLPPAFLKRMEGRGDYLSVGCYHATGIALLNGGQFAQPLNPAI